MGLTLNSEYNKVLEQWEKEEGKDMKPECEHCQCDLTGKEVFDIGYLWVCEYCMNEYYDNNL